METYNSNNRYSRQILLKEFGEASQKKLQDAKILVIGAGGLGCAAIQYLAAAGIGTIGIVDFDVVEYSNLQRQILYGVEDIGKPKAASAAKKLNALNPEISIQTFPFQITNKNALEIVAEFDVVIDGTDNFQTRYMINDACVLLYKPLVYGAVLRFEGQVGVFNLKNNNTDIKVNYRDMFPEPPDPNASLSCNEAGVLGVLPGIIGTMQATEALKIITGIGEPLSNQVLSYNALNNSFYTIEISPDQRSAEFIPKDFISFSEFNYDWFCNGPAIDHEISPEEFDSLRLKEPIIIIDVREINELPLVHEFISLPIPLNEFTLYASSFSSQNKIVLFCNSGKRSLNALRLLKEQKPECIAYSLQGGIEAWKKNSTKTEHHNG